jgi:hypothetical protein
MLVVCRKRAALHEVVARGGDLGEDPRRDGHQREREARSRRGNNARHIISRVNV